MLTVFAHLLSRLRSEAPGVSAEWTAPREPTLLDVAEGQIDVAIVPAELRLPEGVASEAVGALGMAMFRTERTSGVCQVEPPDLDAVAASRRPGRRQPDQPGQCCRVRRRPDRTIAGWVPHFSAIAPVLANSDLLATLPVDRDGRDLHAYDLESREVPFPIAPLPHVMVWSTTAGAGIPR